MRDYSNLNKRINAKGNYTYLNGSNGRTSDWEKLDPQFRNYKGDSKLVDRYSRANPKHKKENKS